MACHQLKDFEAKMVDFENHIAEHIDVFEKGKPRPRHSSKLTQNLSDGKHVNFSRIRLQIIQLAQLISCLPI